MEEKLLQDIFVEILRSVLSDEELSDNVKSMVNSDNVIPLLSLSKRHDLIHVVTYSLQKNGILKDLMPMGSSEAFYDIIFRNEQLRYAYCQICTVLDDAGIAYIPLKGAVIRDFYPEPWMRSSCDVDILVKETDLDSAITALTGRGFRCGERNYHDVSLYAPNGIHLELHFSIQENIDAIDKVLKGAWNHALPADGCRYEFTPEFFIFHMLSHMSYHFLRGGCGVRSLMDVYIMKYKMGITYEDAHVLLERAGIYKFAREITHLTDALFQGTEKSDIHDYILSYIFSGGVYGSHENNIAINNAKTHVNGRYISERVIIGCDELSIEYPVLKKRRGLYVFCLFHRAFKLGIRYLKRTVKRRRLIKRVSDEKKRESRMLRDRLGLM